MKEFRVDYSLVRSTGKVYCSSDYIVKASSKNKAIDSFDKVMSIYLKNSDSHYQIDNIEDFNGFDYHFNYI